MSHPYHPAHVLTVLNSPINSPLMQLVSLFLPDFLPGLDFLPPLRPPPVTVPMILNGMDGIKLCGLQWTGILLSVGTAVMVLPALQPTFRLV